jgi:hypothetical protein
MNHGQPEAKMADRPRRRSVGDRVTRVLLTFFGPAQLGRSPSSDSRRPEGSGPEAAPLDAPPPSGFRIQVYTDASGITHRTLVPDDPAG